jgi:hypothetical protein
MRFRSPRCSEPPSEARGFGPCAQAAAHALALIIVPGRKLNSTFPFDTGDVQHARRLLACHLVDHERGRSVSADDMGRTAPDMIENDLELPIVRKRAAGRDGDTTDGGSNRGQRCP